jgi:hypothetical protein
MDDPALYSLKAGPQGGVLGALLSDQLHLSYIDLSALDY